MLELSIFFFFFYLGCSLRAKINVSFPWDLTYKCSLPCVGLTKLLKLVSQTWHTQKKKSNF